LQQRVVNRSVIDQVIAAAVMQIRIDAAVEGPTQIVLIGELGSEKAPGDGLELLRR
jgi:hypothetical protein